MIALDFFLYDNRTWSSRWGRDWGLKAATGALADRADLKSAFDRYCGAMPGGQGQLSGFGEAIGGVRSPSRDGYLLCVTLECSDPFGRPSWAVFGLWCPDRAMLGQVLSAGDPISSVRALLGNETPPSAIEIRSSTGAVGPRQRRRAMADPAFHRFDPRSTVREVSSLLLGAIQGKSALPNVLGITATARLAAVAQAGFDVVYCHPMDERAERSLAHVLSPQEIQVEEPWKPLLEEPTQPPVARTTRRLEPLPPTQLTRPEPRSSIFPLWLLWLAIGIVGAAVIFRLVDDIRRPVTYRDPSLSGKEQVPASGITVVPPEERSAEAVLDEVRARVRECKKLEPEDLRRSPGFVVAETLGVIPEYQGRRNRVRQAYSTLIEIRNRMVKRQDNYIAYYFDESGKASPPATKLQKIADILREAPLGGEDCRILKEAFGFEFENGDSVVNRWCSSLERLEQTAPLTEPWAKPGPAPPPPDPG